MRALVLIALVAAGGCKEDGRDRGKDSPAETTPATGAPEAPAVVEPPADPASAAEPTAEEQATADKAASALEELGTIAEGARGNCDKAAAAMKAVIDRNRAVLLAAGKLGEDEGKERWLAERYGPRTDAAKSKLMPLMEKCAEHEGIATVFETLE